MTHIIIYALIIVFMPFLLGGIIFRVKSFWSGRQGRPITQLFHDFFKYMKKGYVISGTTGFVFFAAPAVSLLAVMAASLLVPLASGRAVVEFEGAFIIFAYLMAFSKFVFVISALETGSSFEGMGASREATLTAFLEPAFFLIIGTAAAVSGKGSFSALSSFTARGTGAGWVMALLAASGFLIMLVTEGARVPVDDPDTHLELTMIHEVMALDNSGPDMALKSYTAYLKMTLISALFAYVLMPAGISDAVYAGVFLACMILAAVLTGCVESLMARLRMTHVPQFVFFMFSLAVILFSAAFIFMKGAA